MSIKRAIIVLIALAAIVGFAYIGLKDAVKMKDGLEFNKVKLNSKQTEIKELNVKYEQLNQNLDKAAQQKDVDKAEVERLQKEKEELNKQKEELEKQLQSKLQEKSRLALASEQAINTATATQTAHAAAAEKTDTGGVVDCANQSTAKAFIYCHESGNVADKWNSSGCYGLGQDCNGIVYNRCGANYACQDQFFTDYMNRRYGSWEAALAHWQARVPINGRDVGNWW